VVSFVCVCAVLEGGVVNWANCVLEKREREDEGMEEGEQNGIGNVDVDMEDLSAIANEGEGEGNGNGNGEGGVGEEEVIERSAKSAKKEKKARKGRSRKFTELEMQEEEGGRQLDAYGEVGVNGNLETTNTNLDGGVDKQTHAEETNKAKKSTDKKRKRKSGESDTAFDPSLLVPKENGDEAPEIIEKSSAGKVKKRKRKTRDVETALDLAEEQAPKSVETGSAEKVDRLEPQGNFPEEQVEDEVAMLTKNKSAENNGRNSRPRKSQNAIVEGGAQDPEAMQDAIPNGQAEPIPADLVELPEKHRRVQANSSIQRSIQVVIPARVEDDNDSAAAAHKPLTAHTANHQASSGSAHREAAAQLRMDSQSRGSADSEDEMETAPKKTSRKALGKRKASDVGTTSSKKQRMQKDRPAGTPELTAYFFTRSSEPQRRATPLFTPINVPRASILPPSAQPPAVEPEINDDSDESEYIVEAPKSSGRKKKRRLPVGDNKEDPKTPRNKPSRKSNTPKSNAKPAQSRVPPSTGRGRLSLEEVEAIASAVEDYRDQNDLTQVEINDLIQKDAKTDGSQLWKHVSEQVPDIPRVKLLRYCRRTFHNFPARAAWTEEHDQELREAYEKYPGKWKQIGEAINRFSEDCRDRWRNYLACGDNLKKNVWDNEEEQRFKEIVQEVIEMIREIKRVSHDPRDKDKSDESLIDWKVVSQKMNHTRSRLQCMNKWKQLREREDADAKDPVLNQAISATWRLEEGLKNARRMDPKTKLMLLYSIRDFGAGREGTIPWKRVQQEVPGRPRKMAMRVAFRQMRQQIRDNENMKLQDIVDLLIDAYEASVPSEPQGFDGNFEQFHSSQKILAKRKKRTSTLEAEAEAVDSSDDNGEGPSTITKPKRRPRLSEKYVVDNDQEDDDVWAVPRDEQPSNSKRRRTASSPPARESNFDTSRAEPSTKSKRQKTTSSLQADGNRVDSSPTKKKRKLRERMKDIGQSQSSQSQERDDRRHSELSDVHTALESLRTGNSRARLAAAKEAAKSKGKPFLSEEYVIESDEEEVSVHKESSANGVIEATEEELQASEDQVSENEEEPLANGTLPEEEAESPANGDISENDEAPIVNGHRSESEEDPITNSEHSENEDLEADEQEPIANEVELSEHEDLAANDDEIDLDERDANTPGSEGAEDEMDLDNQDTYTAPGGPEEAEDDDSPFGDEEEQIERHDQESVDSQEEQTKHYDHESVDLDATQDTNTNGVDEENEHENQASDAETDFHGCQTDAGSVELDTAVEVNYRKKSPSPVAFEEEPPKTNGFTNGHRHVEEEERVSSDDDDMSDIPATIAQKPLFVEPKKERDKSKSKSKSKSKTKTKRRPVGFR
jgi:hypothetical protein